MPTIQFFAECIFENIVHRAMAPCRTLSLGDVFMRKSLISVSLIGMINLGNVVQASNLDAYQCVLSHHKQGSEIKSSVYYMVLESSLGSGLEGGAVGEFMDPMIDIVNGNAIVGRIYVSDTFKFPSQFKVNLRIVELNGFGEERELASSTFRRGDPNFNNISVQTENRSLAVNCSHLTLKVM